MRIENFYEIQQDTLVLPQQQNRSLPAVNIRKPQIDLERANEIIRQFEQREQEIIQSQKSVVKHRPKPAEPVEEPAIEVNTLWLNDSLQPAVLTPIIETSDARTGISSETKKIDYPSSITMFIIAGLALLTIIKYNFGKNLLETFKPFFNYRQAMRIFEERRESDRQVAFLSNVLFVLITGIFISIAIPFFGASLPWESYAISILFFSATIACLYILKAWIWNVLGIVFVTHTFSKIYIYNMFLYNRTTGLMIFPLVAIIPYVTGEIMPYIIYSVIVTVVLSYIFKLLRIFQIIHGLNVSVFYFILYLCTFEILPLLLLVKCCKILWDFNLFE